MSGSSLRITLVVVAIVLAVIVVRRKAAASQGTRAERESREFALHASAEQMGITVPVTGDGIWGLIVDLGSPKSSATVVMFADGYAGIYWGESGGVFGGQSRESVRVAARSAIAGMEGRASLFSETGVHTLPGEGNIRIYVRRRNDLLSSDEVSLKAVLAGGHPLSPVYELVNKVMTELRAATKAGA